MVVRTMEKWTKISKNTIVIYNVCQVAHCHSELSVKREILIQGKKKKLWPTSHLCIRASILPSEVASALDLDSQHSSILFTGVVSLSVLLYDWLFFLVCIHLMLPLLKWISSLMKMLLCKVLLKRERHIYHTTPKKITLSSNRHCLLTGIGQKIVGSLF